MERNDIEEEKIEIQQKRIAKSVSNEHYFSIGTKFSIEVLKSLEVKKKMTTHIPQLKVKKY